MDFIPLHVKSGYSFLKSCITIPRYVLYAKANGYQKIGIGDNNPFSFCELTKKCKDNNLEPILGGEICFFYKGEQRKIYLYIQNEIGYFNFNQIQKNIQGGIFQGEFINTDGLICVIPSIEGNFFKENFDFQFQRELLFELQDKFKNLYIGSECYKPEHINFLNRIYKFCDESSYKTLAFPLIRALKKSDGSALDILSAITDGSTRASFKEMDTPFFLLSEKALKKVYREEDFIYFKDFNVTFNIFQKRGKLLSIKNIENKRENLYQICINNLHLKGIQISDTHTKRLNYELGIIEKMGFLDYFYIVKEYVEYAKNNNIPVGPGRGSAAGSFVSYCLNITEVNPLEYDLLFERFLNPERVTMPDIDIDFSDEFRDSIIKHIINQYGSNKAKNIITFQTIGPKQALRDVQRIYSFKEQDISYISSFIKDAKSFSDALKNTAFKKIYQDEYFKMIINIAMKIEGLPRQKGIHPAGIIINEDPLDDVLPIQKDYDNLVPFEGGYLEKLGFLKMDILSLKNLTTLYNLEKRVQKIDEKFSLKAIPFNDLKTFELFNNGLTKSIFQFESAGMVSAIKEVKVDCFSDLVALNALYRPGPMQNIKEYALRKKGLLEIKYLDERLKPILQDTYGEIIYQEQIMNIVKVIAGFSLSKADILRRAISKKDQSLIKELKNEFIDGAQKNNCSKEKSEKIYDLIEKFADYGFNKSHSVSYSIIAYQLGYIKAHYPMIFYQEIFNGNTSQAMYSQYNNELIKQNIKFLLPDINLSEKEYYIEENSFRLPLSAISGIARNIEDCILKERMKGKFTSFYNFLLRMSSINLNEGLIKLLINAGAFDCFQTSRTSLKNNIKYGLEYAKLYNGNSSLSLEQIALMEPIIKDEKDNLTEKYEDEVIALGVLLSGSLFETYTNYLKNKKYCSISYAYNNKNKYVQFPCVISTIKAKLTKTNKTMGILNVYDDNNTMVLLIFPKIYDQNINLKKGDYIFVYGKYKSDDIGESFIVDKIEKMEVNNE